MNVDEQHGCQWRDYDNGGRRTCVEPGVVRFAAGPRHLCRAHAADLEHVREQRARAARLRGLG